MFLLSSRDAIAQQKHSVERSEFSQQQIEAEKNLQLENSLARREMFFFHHSVTDWKQSVGDRSWTFA